MHANMHYSLLALAGRCASPYYLSRQESTSVCILVCCLRSIAVLSGVDKQSLCINLQVCCLVCVVCRAAMRVRMTALRMCWLIHSRYPIIVYRQPAATILHCALPDVNDDKGCVPLLRMFASQPTLFIGCLLPALHHAPQSCGIGCERRQ